LKKVNIITKLSINKKRLYNLFKYTNLFDNFSFLFKLISVLIFKFKIKNFYKHFLVKYFINSVFKNNTVFQFKDLRFIFVSAIYILIFLLKKKITNNLLFFIKHVNKICKKLTKNEISQTKRTLKYLIFFTNKINFMFFNNIKSISTFFFKQVFHFFGKFKMILNVNKFNISSNNRFLLNKETNHIINDLFYFRSKLLSNYNNIFFYLNTLGFCYLTKASIINLFFFKKTTFNQFNFPLTKKLKNFFVNCSTLTFNNELKRLRFFIHILNILLKQFFIKNNKNIINFKKLFWIFNLMTFNLSLKVNRFKKNLLFKYNYPFFFKGKQKKVGIFSRKFFFKKQYKLLRFVYNYGGSRFCKHSKKFNIKNKIKRILTKATIISNENFSKFLVWLKQTSKKKRTNIFFKRKDLKKQYKSYMFIKSSLHTTFKTKLFVKNLKKLGFRVSSFFLWAIPKKKWTYSKSRGTKSVRRILWTKGKAYHLNKLSFIKHMLYSYFSPFKIRYSFRKKNKLDDDLNWFHFVYKFINPSKQCILKTYNVNNFFGTFLKYPKGLCLTRKKKKRILKKKRFLRFLINFFRRKWVQRLWSLIKSRKIIARGDSVRFLKYYTRKLQSKKFYFMSKFFFALSKTSDLQFLMDPFSKKIRYNKFFLRYKPYSKQASLAKRKKKKASEKATRRNWSYFRLLRKLKRKKRFLKLKNKPKKIVVHYNKIFLNKSMRNFWFASKKKIQPSFRIYSNLMPWNNTKNSQKILTLHNNLFTKYRQAIELWNKRKYLLDPILFKHFKNMKNSKFFKLSAAQKRKFEKFKNLKRENKIRKK